MLWSHGAEGHRFLLHLYNVKWKSGKVLIQLTRGKYPPFLEAWKEFFFASQLSSNYPNFLYFMIRGKNIECVFVMVFGTKIYFVPRAV